MEENRKVIATMAIDLGREASQICYYKEKMQQPESVSVIPGEKKYLIPTVLGYDDKMNEWSIGDDALHRQKTMGIHLFENVLDYVEKKKNIELGGITISYELLLKQYILGLVNIYNLWVGKLQTVKAVVTMESPDRDIVNLLYQIFAELGVDRAGFKVIGYSESSIYYMLYQQAELWLNDVLIFDFSKTSFKVRQLTTVRSRNPKPIVVEEKDYSGEINYGMIADKTADKVLAKIVSEMCDNHIVSAIYLTGVGFYENWMDESLKVLCTRRRVFQGYNFFVKGAAYATLDMLGIGECRNYQLICTGRTLVTVGIETEEGYVELSGSGINWYDAGAIAEVMPIGIEGFDFIVRSSISRNEKSVHIDISKIPKRPEKMTRLRIAVSYLNDRQIVLSVKDLGFGEFYKASEFNVTKQIDVEEYI